MMMKIPLEKEVADIENLVLKYQNNTDNDASLLLLKKFSNIVKHYCYILSYSSKKICHAYSMNDTFINLLYSKKNSEPIESQINNNLGAIKMIYGRQPKEDIVSDLQMIVLVLAKRYKPSDKSFCAYIKTAYPYEVFRLVHKFCSSLNLFSNKCTYYDFNNSTFKSIDSINDPCELILIKENINKDGFIIPNWIFKKTDTVFDNLSYIQKAIIVMYYYLNLNDIMISKVLGIHINTVNQKRRQATKKLSGYLHADCDRKRCSGKSVFCDGTFIISMFNNFNKSFKKDEAIKLEKRCASCEHMNVCKYSAEFCSVSNRLNNVFDIKCRNFKDELNDNKKINVEKPIIEAFKEILSEGDCKYNRHYVMFGVIIDLLAKDFFDEDRDYKFHMSKDANGEYFLDKCARLTNYSKVYLTKYLYALSSIGFIKLFQFEDHDNTFSFAFNLYRFNSNKDEFIAELKLNLDKFINSNLNISSSTTRQIVEFFL